MRFFFLLSLSLITLNISFAGDRKSKQPLDTGQLYSQRIESLNSTIPLSYNEQVRFYIEDYLKDSAGKTGILLGKSLFYFPLIEEKLRDKKLPPEFKFLAAAESGLDNSLVSSRGGTGIWQMPYNIAKMYNLKINSYVDERKDPAKESMAVGAYLEELKVIYNDWLFVLAAFNATPLNINKAIRLAGESLDYWKVHPYLPAESQEIVNKFIATFYIFNFHKDHKINVIPYRNIDFDTVRVTQNLAFDKVSSVLNISMEDLRLLNPVYRRDLIPFSSENYLLKLPKEKIQGFEILKDSLYQLSSNQVISAVVEESNPDSAGTTREEIRPVKPKPEETPVKSIAPKMVKVTYTVKSGDVLGKIADWYDVLVSDVKKWNNLRNDHLSIGQKLTIMVPSEKQAYYLKINTMSPAEKQKLADKD